MGINLPDGQETQLIGGLWLVDLIQLFEFLESGRLLSIHLDHAIPNLPKHDPAGIVLVFRARRSLIWRSSMASILFATDIMNPLPPRPIVKHVLVSTIDFRCLGMPRRRRRRLRRP